MILCQLSLPKVFMLAKCEKKVGHFFFFCDNALLLLFNYF